MVKSRNELEATAKHVSGQANKPISLPPHALTCSVFIDELSVNAEDGLSSEEAAARLETYGPNQLDDGPGVQPVKILVRQIANAMILVKHTLSLSPTTLF
jgi:magnesium-transporting ATPase (P-type)